MLESTMDDTVCHVYMPTISSAFAIDPSAREKVRLQMLREGKIDPNVEGVAIHPIILDTLKATRSSALELSSPGTSRSTIAIRWQVPAGQRRALDATPPVP